MDYHKRPFVAHPAPGGKPYDKRGSDLVVYQYRKGEGFLQAGGKVRGAEFL